MKRINRNSKSYLTCFEMPAAGAAALVCAIVNQAITDYNGKTKGSLQHTDAKRFLKEWNLIK